VNKHKIL